MLEEQLVVQPAVFSAGRRCFQFMLDLNANSCFANWIYVDSEGNDIQATKTVTKQADDLVALMQLPVDPALTIYDNMKQIIYQYMKD